MKSFEGIAIRSILGTGVHAATMSQALERCRDAIDKRTPLSIGVVNAAKLVQMSADPALREAVQSSDLVLADGMSVVWASRLLRRPLPERVAGIDLFERLLGLAEEAGYSVYLLGAEPEVLEAAVRVVRTRHPRLRIAGSHHGYFSPAEEPALVEAIAGTRPDLLFVGMSSPKKEVFLSRWGGRIGAPICHGVGGSIDVMAGKVQRAPGAWQRAGMEWLYRVLQEPRRLWRRYLVTNIQFLWMVLRELATGRSHRS